MLTHASIRQDILRLSMLQQDIELNLRHLISARLYDLSEMRYFTVSDFMPELIQPLDDGLRMQLVNRQHGLFVPVELVCREDRFVVTIKAGWICEQMSINRRLMGIDVLPDLLETKVNDPGFYVLPDFSGTMVRFAEHEPTVNRDRLYMHQSQWEKYTMLNCFGLKQGRIGKLVIVHKGDFFCDAVTQINQQGTNRLYASFGLRHRPTEPIKQEDRQVIVCLTEGREDDWFDLARCYGDYLANKRGVSPLAERLNDNPTLAYASSAMRVKIFHGLKPFSLDGNTPMKTYTTFAQAKQILDHMQQTGIKRAVVTLVGWNLGGHDGAYPQKFPVEPQLGGEEGLRDLIAYAKSMGYQIVPHDCNTDMYMASTMYDPQVLMRHEDQTPILGGIWGGGQSAKACPLAYFDRYGPDVTRIHELGFEGSYYCDAQSNPLFECHDPNHPADEQQFAISQCKLLQAYRVLYGAVSQEMGPAFSLPFIDEIARVPFVDQTVNRFEQSNPLLARIVDRIVPFYHMAIHGLVTYQESVVLSGRAENVHTRMLRSLVHGARPCIEVAYTSGANGAYYIDAIKRIRTYYAVAFEQLAHVHVLRVLDYQELAATVSRIIYEDGTSLTVNWGPEASYGLVAESWHIQPQEPRTCDMPEVALGHAVN